MDFFLIAFLTLLSSIFGTLTGFGISTIMVSVLAIWFPLPEVLIFVGVIHWFGDVWKMLLFKKGINWKLIWLFGIPGIVASYFGASIPIQVDPSILKRILAVFIAGYTLFLIFKPKWKLEDTNGNALLGGTLSGFFAGLFGVGGAIRGAFLSAYCLSTPTYIFTSGAIAFLIDSSRLIRYYQGDVALQNFSAFLLFISVVISYLGAFIAKRIANKVSQNKFRYVIGFGLLFASVMLFLGY